MQILFCNFEYPPLGGGGGVINALLAQEMAKRHEVTVLTSQGLGLPIERMENGVKIVRVPVYFRRQEAAASLVSMLMFLPMGIKAGKQLLRSHSYDVINTHFVLPTGPVGDALARFAGIPNVLSLHGGDLYDPSKVTSPHRHPLLRTWIRHLLTRADVVVGQSSNTLQNMRRYYTPEIAGTRVPLGIQRPKLEAASRHTYGLKEDDVLLVTVGRLVSRKAVHQLIATVDELKQERVRLLIIGTGPEERNLREEVAKREVGNRILFMGQVDEAEKFRILHMCDLYVSTSQHEGFGLVFLEAMACGLPIVCYDHGGQTDFLRDGENGYLVPLNRIELFREKCRALIDKGSLRKMIGESNQRAVEEYYIDRCAATYEEIFAKACQTIHKVRGI
jgi:glycosyltransferase involved in cell wall biosynthesis